MGLSFIPEPDQEEVEVLVETPQEDTRDLDKEQFCGFGDAKATKYIKEYMIPTECSQPLAITTSPDGDVWFAQSNTGNLGKFDPDTESFSVFHNNFWPRGDESMIWGLAYSTNDTLWFTDDYHNSVWKFDIQNKEYYRLPYEFTENSLPQRIQAFDSRIIVNDFTGNQIVYFDNIDSVEDIVTYSLPSNAPDSVVGDFTMDSQNNLWYTNWILGTGGILAKINQTSFDLSIQNDDQRIEFFMYDLPLDLKTPNGIVHDESGNIWLADSSTSFFSKYDPISGNFTKYVTSDPSPSTFGNFTGKIETAESRPYWMEEFSGIIAFNEQGANRIGVFNPSEESLIEYTIPSQNPHWGDCRNEENCGISAAFDLTSDGDKIWFTEWAENKIGVLDTSILLPFEIQLEPKVISLSPGEFKSFDLVITPNYENNSEAELITKNIYFVDNISISNLPEKIQINSEVISIPVTIFSSESTNPGNYKVLFGAKTDQISISNFVTIIIE